MSVIERIGMNYIATGVDGFDKSIKIPSQMFPLNGSPQMFNNGNTSDCEDKDVLRAYNAVTVKVGHCYNHVEQFLSYAQEYGIDRGRVQSFVGWLFVGASRPIHHCFTLVDGEHIIDFIGEFRFSDMLKQENYSLNEARKFLAEQWIANKDMVNMERFGCGKVDLLYCYVACPCKPQEGRNIYNRLMRTFPNHPCNKNTTATGATYTQNMIMKELRNTHGEDV